MVVLYSSNTEEQFSYIQAAKEKGYKVIILDSPIVFILSKIETSNDKSLLQESTVMQLKI